MDKDEWRGFVRFLDEANEEELRRRKAAIVEVLTKVTDPDVRSDARRMMRLIDQETLAREGLSTRAKGQRSKKA